MKMLFLSCLVIAWGCLIVPNVLRKHREGRPSSDVESFRRHLSTLERATPGTSLRNLGTSPRMAASPAPMATARRSAPAAPAHVVRRRRDVLIGLLGATGLTFLVLIVSPGMFTGLLFLASAGSLGAYVYALVQLRMRADEAANKVRVLRPQATLTARPQVATRRSATS